MDPAVAIEAAALSLRKAIDDATAVGDSDVQKFYKDTVIFLTGGSGFLGKQLIEKLFRSCKISKVYMLLRSKKGKDIKERLEEMFQDQVFSILRKQQPDFQDKIQAVEGDVSARGLGIKHEDWRTLTEQVDVIFHVAATTRFDEALQQATLINVRGTREAILLGKSCKKLRSFVYVSTAFTHATADFLDSKIEEKFYSAPVLPEAMISMAEDMDSDRLLAITKELIMGWPNTYTFTKSLSEQLVRSMSEAFPICVVRPAIVINTYREPVPGWLDMSCVYGATGLIVGGGLGVLHALYGNDDSKTALIPCDYVNNAIIVAGRETAISQSKGVDPKIYTITSTYRNPVTLGNVSATAQACNDNIPTPKAIYYSYVITAHQKWLFLFLSLVLHIIPAYIADFVCLLMGRPRRFVKTATKVYKLGTSLSHFIKNDWKFVDDNLSNLYSSLSKTDKVIFNFDVKDINWKENLQLWCIGARKYIVKDGLKDNEYAIKKQKYLKIANYIIMTLYCYGLYKLFYMVLYVGSSLLRMLITTVAVII